MKNIIPNTSKIAKKRKGNRISQSIIVLNPLNDTYISSERRQVISRIPTYKNSDPSIKNTTENNMQSNFKMEIVNSKTNDIIKNHYLSSTKVNRKPKFTLEQKLASQSKNSKDIDNDLDKKRSIENIIKSTDTLNLHVHSNEYGNNSLEGEKYISEYFSNISYFSDYSMQKLKEDCLFCVSGKALRHIFDNKDKSLFSKLLKILSKKTKIYFSMTSEDKSFIIDYYRNLSDKKICMVGYSISDVDSMMTAHVGISLKKPTNKNMILCHFYISSKNLIGIKEIIAHGKVAFENKFLLLISSIFCISIIDIYMAISFYILMNIKPDHLRIFNCIFYCLSLFGFTNSGDKNIDNSLMKKNIIFWKYIIIQLIGIILIKELDAVLFFILYRKNDDIEENKRNEIFITYYSILSYNKIFSTLFSFNFIRFYRRSIIENYIFFFYYFCSFTQLYQLYVQIGQDILIH